jgi:ribose transport system substrate-binding protein
MTRRHGHTSTGLTVRLLLTVCALLGALTLLVACSRGEERARIGFSQVTTTEPWRVLFNREMRAEAARHEGVELIIADGQDRTEKQVADVESFIRQRMDVILISPKESAGLAGVVERATAAGIPVIVLDRGVATDRYRQFIGGDNEEIGSLAGSYARDLLGGQGRARGKIVEIWGGMGSTPAQERHRGFAEVLEAEAEVEWLVERQDGDWKQDQAYDIMSTALKAHHDIDLVYAHNDPMAFGAYLAAKDAGREKEIRFLGIDAIPEEGGEWVRQGYLTATFIYETPGARAIQQAVRLLAGEAIPREVTLETGTVDASNVASYLEEKAK